MKNKYFIIFLAIALISSHFMSTAQVHDEECIICFQPLFDKKNDVIILSCSAPEQKHQFHFSCIHQWKDKKFDCPYCRTSLNKGSYEQRLYSNHVIKPLCVKPVCCSRVVDYSESFFKDLGLLLSFCCCAAGEDRE